MNAICERVIGTLRSGIVTDGAHQSQLRTAVAFPGSPSRCRPLPKHQLERVTPTTMSSRRMRALLVLASGSLSQDGVMYILVVTLVP